MPHNSKALEHFTKNRARPTGRRLPSRYIATAAKASATSVTDPINQTESTTHVEHPGFILSWTNYLLSFVVRSSETPSVEHSEPQQPGLR